MMQASQCCGDGSGICTRIIWFVFDKQIVIHMIDEKRASRVTVEN